MGAAKTQQASAAGKHGHHIVKLLPVLFLSSHLFSVCPLYVYEMVVNF
jgi:hypothetical protein